MKSRYKSAMLRNNRRMKKLAKAGAILGKTLNRKMASDWRRIHGVDCDDNC